jgi:peptide/nickel transport system substrate-binding protein
MRQTIFLPLLVSLLTGTALAEPTPGGVANLIVQPEPPGIMIGITTNAPALDVGGNIYEGLLRYDEKLNPMPSLAKSWDISPDGTTYTFHLQDNISWHDGQPMTAADVLFTVNDFLTKTQPRHRNIMTRVKSVTAPGDKTVVFTLNGPFEPFIRALSFATMPIVPKHIYEGTDYAANPANQSPVGTGPFKLTEWKKGSYIKLDRNTDYYIKGKPYLDELIYQIIPDAASRAIAYETGNVDILPGGSVENFDIPRLSQLPNTCITDKGQEYNAPLAMIWMNNRVAPMDNLKFRQAVEFALDRDFAKDVLWNGYGKIATSPFSSLLPFYSKQEPQYSYDPAKAKALLAESGYDGRTLRLLPTPYGETWQRWAEAVKQNLEEIGIPVEIQTGDTASYNQRVSNWDFDLAFTFVYQYGDPAIGGDRHYKTSQIMKGNPFNNVAGYSNPEADALFDAAAVAYPASERQKLYDQVQAKILEDAPVAWLLELGFPILSNCKFKNVVTTANGISDAMRDVYIEK